MQMYGTFDENGRVNGFYSDDIYPPDEDGNINPDIPAGAIALDAETYAKVFEYQDQWRLVDGEIVPYTVPPPTPQQAREEAKPTTARQFRLALSRNGITNAGVVEAIADLPDATASEEQMIEWEYGTLYKRLDHLVLTIANAYSKTPEQMDAIWTEALAIT